MQADDFSLDRRGRPTDIVIPRAVLVGYFVESCSLEDDPFISYQPRMVLTSVVGSLWKNNKFISVNSFQLFHIIWYVKDYSDVSLDSSCIIFSQKKLLIFQYMIKYFYKGPCPSHQN